MTARWRLSNGLMVLYQRDSALPLAAATLLIPTGSRQEADTEAGLCSLTFEMLLRGTRRKSARQVADAIESIGGSLGVSTGEDFSEVDWLVPAAQAERTLALFVELLTQPAWPTRELAKEKVQVVADLRRRHDAIFNVAYDMFRAELFQRHPYARLVDGHEATVGAFTVKDLARWHRQFIRPEGAIFSLIGPWPEAEARRLLESALRHWTKKKLSRRRASPTLMPKAPHQPKAITVPSTFQQAYLMVGTRAPALKEAQGLPLKVWNMILGGGMSSRLFVQLREERGLAYEVSSFYASRLEGSSWAAYLGLPPERLVEAETALAQVLETMAKRGPTEREVQQAKRMMEGSYVMDHQTRRRQAWYAAWWEFLGRAPEYDHRHIERIRAVSLSDVRQAGTALLEQARLQIKVIPQ